MAMIKCPNCGNSISSEATFCVYCGKNIEGLVTVNTSSSKTFVDRKIAKKVGTKVMGVTGSILGAPYKVVGAVFKSDYIKELGDAVKNTTKRTGEIVGTAVDGIADVAVGVLKSDSERAKGGLKQTGNTALDFGKGVIKGAGYVGKTVIDGVTAAVDGDKQGVIESAKVLGKVAVVSANAITVGDVIGGITHHGDITQNYDLDGDGFADVAIFDSNGDGLLDAAAFDLNGDGIADAVETLTDLGIGTVDGAQSLDGTYESLRSKFVDVDGDGKADMFLSSNGKYLPVGDKYGDVTHMADRAKVYNSETVMEVVRESSSGLNLYFRNKESGAILSRAEFVDAIKRGEYTGYNIRKLNGVEVPVSRSDDYSSNNLG